MDSFWVGISIAVGVNLATGLLLSIVFETLQRRRDLQRQLGEIWLLATRASEAVNHARLSRDKGAAAYGCWLALQNEWLRARHSLNFALTDSQRDQLEESISAIYQLHILNADRGNRKYFKLHRLPGGEGQAIDGKASDGGGGGGEGPVRGEGIEAGALVDYGTWAERQGLPEEAAAYHAFMEQRKSLNSRIEHLLHFDPLLIRRRTHGGAALSLPNELEQAWHFTYLFARVWRWFFAELAFSFFHRTRQQK